MPILIGVGLHKKVDFGLAFENACSHFFSRCVVGFWIMAEEELKARNIADQVIFFYIKSREDMVLIRRF